MSEKMSNAWDNVSELTPKQRAAADNYLKGFEADIVDYRIENNGPRKPLTPDEIVAPPDLVARAESVLIGAVKTKVEGQLEWPSLETGDDVLIPDGNINPIRDAEVSPSSRPDFNPSVYSKPVSREARKVEPSMPKKGFFKSLFGG